MSLANCAAYFNPKHNMFLSCALAESDIDQALQAAEAGLCHVAGLT